MRELKGKTALITGAASGIGRALAHALAREGMKLYLVDLDEAGLASAKSEVEALGATCRVRRADVASYEEWKRTAEAVERDLGPLDMLINNAGIAGAGLIEELEPETYAPVFEVNTWSIIYSTRVFLPGMIQRGTGHIVNVASGAGIVGIPYHVQYVVSKFAAVGLSEALYSEIKHLHPGIDVSVICPSFLKTNIIDRTSLELSKKFAVKADQALLDEKKEAFAKLFWEKYTEGAPELEKVVRKYVRGIKKGKLYIVNMPDLRVASVLKGLSDALYRKALRHEGKRHVELIKGTLAEIGIQPKDPK